MPLNLTQVVNEIEKLFPLYLAEPGDKVGLQVGDPNQKVHRILIVLDVTLAVVKEAVRNKVNLIISHHPLIYNPLSSLATSSPLAQMVTRLIEHKIGVYVAHTNLDFAPEGTIRYLAEVLALQKQKNLIPFDKTNLRKMVVFIPSTHLDKVAQAMFDAGAGVIGNYSECSFRTEGIGTFRAGDSTHPFLGKVGKREYVKEVRLETIVPGALIPKVVSAMIHAHPYEEVAYDIYPLANPHPQATVCVSGRLAKPAKLVDFAKTIKNKLQIDTIRIVGDMNRIVKTVAVVTGSGMSLLDTICKAEIDVFVTGDVKYHQARVAELYQLAILDVSHYTSEIIYLPRLKKKLTSALPAEISILVSKHSSDPIQTI